MKTDYETVLRFLVGVQNAHGIVGAAETIAALERLREAKK